MADGNAGVHGRLRFPHKLEGKDINHPSAALSTLLRNLRVYGTVTGKTQDTSLLQEESGTIIGLLSLSSNSKPMQCPRLSGRESLVRSLTCNDMSALAYAHS